MQEKEESSWFNPYNYETHEASGGYSFFTDCNTNFLFGFKTDEDLFGYELNDHILLTLQFDKTTFNKVKSNRVSSTICQAINDTLCSNPSNAIWYICSLKPFEEEEKKNRSKYSLLRQKIFTRWYYKHKSIFPNIKFATYGTKESPLNPEPIHMGFLYHNDFQKFEELHDILDLISIEQIASDKETYSLRH